VRADSPKTEDDFPALLFTARPADRKRPPAGVGEIARAARLHDFLTGATATPTTGTVLVGVPHERTRA
jgi:hypothetical protein